MRRHLLVSLASFTLATAGAIRIAPADDAKPAASVKDPTLARKAFDEGEMRREEGRWTEAARAFGEAIGADPSLWLAHVRYQECVTAAGEGSFLAKDYDRLLEASPSDVPLKLHRMRLDAAPVRLDALGKLVQGGQTDRNTVLELARAQLATGAVPAAKKTLEALWVQKPDREEVLFLSVEALRLSGDVAGARARLEGALRADKDLWEATLRLARLDLQDGKWDAAAQRADAVLALRPSHVPALLVKSEALSRVGKIEDARTALDTALRINPSDGAALVASADLMARAGTEEALKKAVGVYQQALSVKNTPVPALRAWYGIAWAQERSNLLPDAYNSYREAGLLAPFDAGVVNSIGVVLLKQKKFQDAVLQFQKAIGLDKDAPEAYANLGAVADEQTDWNEGIKWYEKVLGLKGQDKNLRALLCAAFDYEALGSYKKAEEFLAKAKAVKPDDAEITTFLGDNQYFQHKWKAAEKSYEEATRLDAKNRFAWRGLGLAHYEDEDFKEAVDALEKAKALKADDLITLLALGDLYSKEKETEDLDKALASYEAYVKAGGNNPDVPVLIEALKKAIEDKKKGGG